MNIVPLESEVDYCPFFKKYRRELKFIDKRFKELTSIEWLTDMDQWLFDLYRFLTTKQLYGDYQFLDLRVIQYLLNKNEHLIIDQEDGKKYYHLDKDRYNEFGVELRKECFSQASYTKSFTSENDNND